MRGCEFELQPFRVGAVSAMSLFRGHDIPDSPARGTYLYSKQRAIPFSSDFACLQVPSMDISRNMPSKDLPRSEASGLCSLNAKSLRSFTMEMLHHRPASRIFPYDFTLIGHRRPVRWISRRPQTSSALRSISCDEGVWKDFCVPGSVEEPLPLFDSVCFQYLPIHRDFLCQRQLLICSHLFRFLLPASHFLCNGFYQTSSPQIGLSCTAVRSHGSILPWSLPTTPNPLGVTSRHAYARVVFSASLFRGSYLLLPLLLPWMPYTTSIK